MYKKTPSQLETTPYISEIGVKLGSFFDKDVIKWVLNTIRVRYVHKTVKFIENNSWGEWFLERSLNLFERD